VNNALHFASGNDDTGTPWDFFIELDAEFNFVCDMAASAENTKCPDYFGPDHEDPEQRDCLSAAWPLDGVNWLNPPYSEPEHPCKKVCKKKLCEKRGFHTAVYRPGCLDFVRKAAEQRLWGVTTVALLAARTDTAWFHEFVWDKTQNTWREGVTGRFIQGRLKFEGHTDSAPFPSLVVIFKGVDAA
jgi:site-specific DNA-methyltransferase (adenine-specific)